MTGAAAGKVSVYAAAVELDDCSVTALEPAVVLANTSVPRVVDCVPSVTADVKVGLVANTRGPDPVSSVTADARFALDGVAKNVATPAPRPSTPVLIGNPVAFVRVPDDGVPNAPPLTTKAPADPTLTPRAVATPVPKDVIPVPPLATGNVPVTPVVNERPEQFVNVPLEGVPNAPPLTTNAPAEPTLMARAVATPVPSPDNPLTETPVQFARLPLLGVPRAPLNVTNAPAEPTLTAKAVRTPVPVPVRFPTA